MADDELLEVVGHFGVDVGVHGFFFLFVFVGFAEVDGVTAREEVEFVGELVAHGHDAGAPTGTDRDGCVGVEFFS